MPDFNNIKKTYFLGIGGIGMSALARHFNSEGVQVYGYDKTETELTKQLEKEGMKITYEDTVATIPQGIDLVVYTPAIPKEHLQFNYFLQNNFTVKKRSEILQEITHDKFTIAIAGSHGKTSVTTMIAHVLKHSGYDCTAFLGGISLNYQSNYLRGKNNVVVVEADEFDRSFLRLNPDMEIVTAVDTDHLDIYGSWEKIEEAFIEFTQKIKPKGIFIGQSKISILPKVKAEKIFTYNFSDASANYFVTNAALNEGAYFFDIAGDDGIAGMTLQMGGRHNVENALAAYTVARQLGIEREKIKEAFAAFKGVKRRFEFMLSRNDFVFIDDYAHHPEEINALIGAVRSMYPAKKITAIFQPHLFSRTKDLHKEFAASLDKADEVIVLDIYPAREKPMPGVTSAMITQEMKNPNKRVMSKGELLSFLENKKPEALLTIGAGDIDTLVQPIKKIFERNGK
ncbi:MAG: UDP-N-acetylmuramate--L-alanine ligase [Chitinophagales bacterium]|nr:UDP-N-acetylmuramate--L-alanine ligase [Chitinophagales bacterium]